MRFSEALTAEVFELWKEKALELASKYPRACMVVVTENDSPFWLQILNWREFFDVHGNRIRGVFRSREEAEAYLDQLRERP